ncbi:MAG: hypothetical protein HGB02_05375 [Chlorobiaceae bacterium]|nr:hypothetical protein [Chlorobiaceae bacterium]
MSEQRIVREQIEQCYNLLGDIADEVVDCLECTMKDAGSGMSTHTSGIGDKWQGTSMKFLELNQRCLKLVALIDSITDDLLKVCSIMKASRELEQVGDLARHIVELRTGIGPELFESFGFNTIGNLTVLLAIRSLDAFIMSDPKAFDDVITIECELDDMHRQLHDNAKALLQASMYSPGEMLASRSLSWHLERVAAHASGISKSSMMAFFELFTSEPVDIGQMMPMTGFRKN